MGADTGASRHGPEKSGVEFGADLVHPARLDDFQNSFGNIEKNSKSKLNFQANFTRLARVSGLLVFNFCRKFAGNFCVIGNKQAFKGVFTGASLVTTCQFKAIFRGRQW